MGVVVPTRAAAHAIPIVVVPIGAAPLPLCPTCDSISDCQEKVAWSSDWHNYRCRADLVLKLGSFYLDGGQRASAIETYREDVRDGSLAAEEKLKELGEPYAMPWTPLKFTLLFIPPVEFPREPKVYGLSISPLMAGDAVVAGLQIGDGALAHKAYGMQIGAGTNADMMRGLQLGGINLSKNLRGVQIGVLNGAGKVVGAQIGLYNDCKSIRGLQLGLINHETDARLKWLPLMRLSL